VARYLQNPSNLRLIRPLVLVFFIVYLALGLLLVGDYGVGWDEQYERLHGLVVMDYFNELSGDRLFDQPLSEYKLDNYFNRTYGSAFQTVALGLEFALGLDDIREWHLLRHYMTFLVWFIGLVFFYKLLQLRFRNPAFSLIGVVFMILSPRIFADAFYNSKDIVFLALYIISTFTLIRFIRKSGIQNGFYHALSCALLINTRILGIIVPLITLLFLTFQLFRNPLSKPTINHYILLSTYYLAFLFILIVLFWPYLWENPVGRLIESFLTMGHFPWDDPVLYWGKFISATQLPFHYIPSWMLITTPVLYMCLFLAGTGYAISHLNRRFFTEDSMIDKVNLVLFVLPLLAVILLHSTLYDGWRQMFFLYGPFMMLTMTGFWHLMQGAKSLQPVIISKWARMALLLLVLSSAVNIGAFMVRNHPNQNVYFNFIAGKETTRNFEADYWGLSYRQALEHILQEDERDSILVFAINYPGRANLEIFPPGERNRIVFTDPAGADYWISNYRFPGEHDRYFRKDPPYDRLFWERRVRGNAIVGVYLVK
jgi:hypothetical protein